MKEHPGLIPRVVQDNLQPTSIEKWPFQKAYLKTNGCTQFLVEPLCSIPFSPEALLERSRYLGNLHPQHH